MQAHTAFTLVELLVVVAVLTLLAAIGSAHYNESINKADRAACQQNLHSIYTALLSYRVDYGQFPLADCVADTKPRMDKTAWGCAPAANGFWCGAPLVLTSLNYIQESSLYCPALQRDYSNKIGAYSSCSESSLSGTTVPQWKFLRFAYNSAAMDVGGYKGGEHNIKTTIDENVWLVRCLHVDVGQYHPERDIQFPFRIKDDPKHSGYAWYGEFELNIHGNIRERAVVRRKSF